MVTSRSENTRDAILKAATEAMSAAGAGGLRIDSVARAARVNKRMIYHHFGDKEGLIQAVYRQQARHVTSPFNTLRPESREIFGILLKGSVGEDPKAPSGGTSGQASSPSFAQLCQAAEVLLPVLMRMSPDPAELAGVTSEQWWTFTADVMCLVLTDVAEAIFGVAPGSEAFDEVSKRSLTELKPRYRLASTSRRR